MEKLNLIPRSGSADVPHPQPSLPQINAGISYWHRSTRAFPYLNHNGDKQFPKSASVKYVIIGAGLTGALTAFKLLEAGVRGSDVMILEAREAVSGSTGRNAGHIRPDAFRNFSSYTAAHGELQAMKIVELERSAPSVVGEFVRSHNIKCGLRLHSTLDVCFSQEVLEDEEENIKEFRKAGGNIDELRFYYGEEAKSKTGFNDALAAYEWPAASIHPVKLVHWLLTYVIEKGVDLWTSCPVTSFAAGIGGTWTVHTVRGTISADKIAHCTNAYAGALLDQFNMKKLTPIRIQVHSLIPPAALCGLNAIKPSMALRESKTMFFGLVQMEGDGALIVSVGRPAGIGFDDSSVDQKIAQEVEERLKSLFPQAFDKPALRHGEGLDHSWTGLISITPDKVPYVGAINELPGQFICAGFNGHGMASIFQCSAGLVTLMLGGIWESTQLPECFQYSSSRLAKRT